MPGPKCVVEFCRNSSYKTKTKGENLAFHRFPRDPGLRKQWLQKCGKVDSFNSTFAFVCSTHFSSDDYKRDMQAELLGYVGRRKLKPDAVPSLNLPYEEENDLSPAEKAKAEKEKHNKLIEECLNNPSDCKGVLSFDMFKKVRYKGMRIRTSKHHLSEEQSLEPRGFLLKTTPAEYSNVILQPVNDDRINNMSNSEDDLTTYTVDSDGFQFYLREDNPVDSEGASCSADETMLINRTTEESSEDPSYLKKRVKELEDEVNQQRKIICKLKRGILREKKMMEKIFLATTSGNGSLPQKKKRIQYDEKARNAILEIYSFNPQSYARISKALNLPAKSILSTWNPEICPPHQPRGDPDRIDCYDDDINNEVYVIETIES